MSWLSPWLYRKRALIPPQTGADASFQVPLTVYYGAGVDGAGVVYLNKKCNDDFSDLRFTDGSGVTLQDYAITSKTDRVSASVWVEVRDNLASVTGQIYLYYGNTQAVSASSLADTFVSAPISGVVGAWTLEEADAEVNPTVIFDEEGAPFWTKYNDVTAILTTDNTTKTNGASSLKYDCAAIGASGEGGFYHDYAPSLNISTKSLIKFDMYGANTGKKWLLKFFNTGYAVAATYEFTENWAGWKTVAVPFGSFDSQLVWADVAHIYLYQTVNECTVGVRYFDRLVADVGVVAVDSSGYGNHGAATGTTIIAGKWAGKNARQILGATNGDLITVPDDAALDLAGNFSVVTYIKVPVLPSAWQCLFSKDDWGAGAINYELFISDTNTLDFVTHNGAFGDLNSAAITADTWLTVTETWDGTTKQLYINNTMVSVDPAANQVPSVTNTDLLFGKGRGGFQCDFVMGPTFIVTNKLSAATVANLVAYYPDLDLIAGSVCPRKYASGGTQPAFTTWYAEETVPPPTPKASNRNRRQLEKQHAEANRKRAILDACIEYFEFKQKQRRIGA